MTYYKCSVTGKVHQFEECMNGGTHTPVVVIDPEDREQVERLIAILRSQPPGDLPIADRYAFALREFANPTPPKPAEPMGLGAVVKDAAGRKWIRVAMPVNYGTKHWAEYGEVAHITHWRSYQDIDVVEVLSEGVTE